MESLLEIHLYGNWTMLDPDDAVMCRLGNERAEWYLKKGLADQVDDHTIKLRFKPKGPGARDDDREYMLSEKANICVVCGQSDDLTKHHVVPYQFRFRFPDNIKSNSGHDVVLLCIKHHKEYEDHAQAFTLEIASSYGLEQPVQKLSNDARTFKRISGLAYVLSRADAGYKGIPNERVAQIRAELEQLLGREIEGSELLTIAADHRVRFKGDAKVDSIGKLISDRVNELGDHEKFIIGWRSHFVEMMEPKFLPKGWNVNFKIFHDD